MCVSPEYFINPLKIITAILILLRTNTRINEIEAFEKLTDIKIKKAMSLQFENMKYNIR